MENVRVAIVITAITIFAHGEFTSSYWKNGGVTSSIHLKLIFSINADNQELCCVHCYQESSCYMMTIDTDTNTCNGYSQYPDNTTQLGSQVKLFYLADENCDGDGYIFEVSHYLWYRVHTEKKSWQEAMSTCNGENGTLIATETSAKIQFVAVIASMMQGSYLWVGGKRGGENNTFFWSNGETVSSSNELWREGEPNNNNKEEDCLAFLTYKLNDAPCYFNLAFICVK